MGLALAVTALAHRPAQALQFGFAGVYDPANWTFETGLGDGSVNTTGAPNSIVLTGSNNDVEDIFTIFTIAAPASGPVTFDWSFINNDGPDFEIFGYLLNGNFQFIAADDGSAGATTFGVVAGDVFGFSIDSTDGCCGEGIATISNFSAPVPGPLPMLGAAAAFSWSRPLRRRVASAKTMATMDQV
ncbi:hypothetical protein [Synechococcus sp. ATX 2A4]|uniref:hypothetical protein n=1 Tax=Synechococcus sp. ATX 2A4 TaxID=2823727 RepID=UPI0020CEFE4F|nr:hypothetical protein [Synechococcus sp. ATX 2A4]